MLPDLTACAPPVDLDETTQLLLADGEQVAASHYEIVHRLNAVNDWLQALAETTAAAFHTEHIHDGEDEMQVAHAFGMLALAFSKIMSMHVNVCRFISFHWNVIHETYGRHPFRMQTFRSAVNEERARVAGWSRRITFRHIAREMFESGFSAMMPRYGGWSRLAMEMLDDIGEDQYRTQYWDKTYFMLREELPFGETLLMVVRAVCEHFAAPLQSTRHMAVLMAANNRLGEHSRLHAQPPELIDIIRRHAARPPLVGRPRAAERGHARDTRPRESSSRRKAAKARIDHFLRPYIDLQDSAFSPAKMPAELAQINTAFLTNTRNIDMDALHQCEVRRRQKESRQRQNARAAESKRRILLNGGHYRSKPRTPSRYAAAEAKEEDMDDDEAAGGAQFSDYSVDSDGEYYVKHRDEEDAPAWQLWEKADSSGRRLSDS